eukprot:TRINITY_DN22874_c0_g1_i1.p1 TRINITY_DN22874_c0_g1~~TRINITY_DN22874_c0_g1_i1.p1  ORF type:complete len:371 (+),score=58.33 TRINITY_DN22874_c0_g1_i1:224-1336(+)
MSALTMACVAARSVAAAGGKDLTRFGCASSKFIATNSTSNFASDVRIAWMRGAASMAIGVVTPVTRVGVGKEHFRASTCYAPKASRFCSAAEQEGASSSKTDNKSGDESTSSTAEKDAASSAKMEAKSNDEAVLGPHREAPFPLPAAWRDPGEWVDLEFTRAGLDPDLRQDKSTIASPWGQMGFEHPDSNVLWPHRALSEHRSRPFTLPRGHTSEVSTAEAEQLEMNRSRLAALWRMSASHGISWDELDDAYVCFAQDGKRRYDEWSRKSDVGIKAVYEKDKARERAVGLLRRYCGKGSKGPEERFPSAVRRLHTRLYTRAKKEWLAPFRPGKLSKHLQQLVAARMLRRETHERALGLVGSKATSSDAAR